MTQLPFRLLLLIGAAYSVDPAGYAQSAEATVVPTAPAAPKPVPPPRNPEDASTPKLFKRNRHDGFMKRKAEGPVGMLFLGDSITDGWPNKGKDTWARFAPYHPADFGVSAMRTEGLLWNITHGELDGIHPKVAVVLIGINNILQCPDEKPEWVAAGVGKVVETIHAKLPDTKVLVLAIFPARNPSTHPARARILAANEMIAKLGDGQRTRYLDIGKIFLDANGEVRKDLMPDGLHPNAAGYQLWYDAMQPVLGEWLK